MKCILFTYIYPFHPERGGIERVTDLIAKSLIQRGYRVLYLCSEYPDSYRGYDYPAQIYLLPSPDLNSDQNFKFYEEFLLQNRVDVVVNQSHINGFNLFLNSGSAQVRKISVIHGKPLPNYRIIYFMSRFSLKKVFGKVLSGVKYYIRGGDKRIINLRAKRLQFITDNSDMVCLLSDQFREEYQTLVANSDKKIAAIPNPNTYRKQSNIPPKKRQLLYVGRLTLFDKRFDRVIAIWERIYRDFPDWEMVFVGDGDDREYLEDKIKRLERVKVAGFQDPKPFYEEAAILCMTSVSEGFPMVLAEAMVHGVVPVVFNSFASVVDIVDDGESGLLVDAFEMDEYVEKLRGLMEDSEMRERMSECAIKSVEKFDIEAVTDRWEQLFFVKS